MILVTRGKSRTGPALDCAVAALALRSDPATGALRMEAIASEPAGAQLVVWTPTSGDTHAVETSGLENVVVHDVMGGRILTAVPAAPGPYSLELSPR